MQFHAFAVVAIEAALVLVVAAAAVVVVVDQDEYDGRAVLDV